MSTIKTSILTGLITSVQNEYDYTVKAYTPRTDHELSIFSEQDVVNMHFRLADFFIQTGEEVRYGILNFGLLSSAVSRQSVCFGGFEKWQTPYEKIATLTFGIDKNHAFHDGNKRTALLCMLNGIHKLNRLFECSSKELERLLIRIAANELDLYKGYRRYKYYGDDAPICFIADFIRRNSRKIDNSFRSLTFEEFNRKLKKYDVWLDNPSGNTINVYQAKNKKYLCGLLKRTQDERILQIGFPGWKRQVNPKAFKSVLQAAGLTVSNGIDMKSFYEGNESEYVLLDKYFALLQRLKDE